MPDDVVVVWGWECPDPKRRTGWRQLTWKMTEDHAGTWARANATEVPAPRGLAGEKAGCGQLVSGATN